MQSDAGEHAERDQDGPVATASPELLAEPQQGAAVSLESVRRHMTCPICAGLVASSLVLHCSHIFCGDCLFQHLSAKPQCPQCQVNLRAIPVRCLALDAVSATFAKTLDPQAQVRYENRAEEGKAAANKLNKMFWWLQSPMAVSGPDAVGGVMQGGPPSAYTSGMQQPSPSLQQRHSLPSQGGAAGALVGAQAFMNLQQQGSQSLLAPGLPGQLQSSCSSGGAGPGRVRPPSQLAHQQLQLPPQPKHLPGANNSVSVPHGATDRIARGSHSGASSQLGAGQCSGLHHRRNSEGSNLPSPDLIGVGSNGGAPPAITGRRSFCNGDSSAFSSLTPIPNPLAQGSIGGAAPTGVPFNPLAFHNPSAAYNAFADLQQQYSGNMMLSGLAGMPPNNMMMGGAPGLQEQAMVHQLLQQMYLSG